MQTVHRRLSNKSQKKRSNYFAESHNFETNDSMETARKFPVVMDVTHHFKQVESQSLSRLFAADSNYKRNMYFSRSFPGMGSDYDSAYVESINQRNLYYHEEFIFLKGFVSSEYPKRILVKYRDWEINPCPSLGCLKKYIDFGWGTSFSAEEKFRVLDAIAFLGTTSISTKSAFLYLYLLRQQQQQALDRCCLSIDPQSGGSPRRRRKRRAYLASRYEPVVHKAFDDFCLQIEQQESRKRVRLIMNLFARGLMATLVMFVLCHIQFVIAFLRAWLQSAIFYYF